MGDDDNEVDDYYYYYYDPFEGYEVTSTNPGWILLTATVGLVAFSWFIATVLHLRKIRHDKRYGTKNYKEKIRKRYNEETQESESSNRRDKDFELLDLDHSKFDLYESRRKFVLEKVSYTNVYYRKRHIPSKQRKRHRLSREGSFFSLRTPPMQDSTKTMDIQEEDEKAINRDSMYILRPKEENRKVRKKEEADDYKQMEDAPDHREVVLNRNREELKKEVKEMFGLAIPWAFSSFVVNAASIVTIALVSHYIGTAEMICYSYVWFILDAAHLVSDAMYSSLYKHASNCVALGTDEAYYNAGKFIRVCVVYNAILSVPICIGIFFSMGHILQWFGYGERIVSISYHYTIVAVVEKFISVTNMYVTIVPDLEGHAGFDAMYGLFDSTIDILIALFVIPFFKPTLLELGLIHLGKDVVSLFVYYALTWKWKGWFDNFKYGLWDGIDARGTDGKLIKSLLKKTIPLIFDAITAEMEWLVLTFFAAYLGAAEAATWILISHIWGFVSIVPENISSATEYKVAQLLSNGNIYLAKKLSTSSMWMASFSSAISCALLYLSRNFIVNGVTNEETLDGMLLEIIPYIALCDPILSVSTAASYLNRALALYRRATKVEFFVTVLVTFPLAVFSTYVMEYNIEGIAASMYAGYAVMGFVNMMVFMNADWDKAMHKNKMMTSTEGVEVNDEEAEGFLDASFLDDGQLEVSAIFKGGEIDD